MHRLQPHFAQWSSAIQGGPKHMYSERIQDVGRPPFCKSDKSEQQFYEFPRNLARRRIFRLLTSRNPIGR